ncbi:ExbD/TolR family protein [Calycomorphotria hydatis]|uniref:Biopolymer transport protein ExbD/TolR n=1 Tax=Calycomorphotria hydatis TaxID=2528027 RepID=A0A517T7V6_9PLAN|nr:biopolymer transporter ExbD [Calycomorphotria hydatis]QDT64458.1 Biopolymer transport protein ExbD/TolR [Calycomorphotria hydatis]
MRSASTFIDDEEEGVSLSRHGRKKQEIDLDITPMIDVTFLLLIFFMVTSTMKDPDSADLPASHHGVGVEQGESLIVLVTGAEEDTTVVFPDGKRFPIADVLDRDLLRTLVEEGLAMDPPRNRLVLNGDQDGPYGAINQLAQSIAGIEGLTIHLGVQDPIPQ